MKTLTLMLAFAVVCATCLSARAESLLVEMEEETTLQYGYGLAEELGKEKDLQFKIDADIFKSKGLQNGSEGIIIVPAKGMKEDVVDPAAETEAGSGFAYLFMSARFKPTIDGKPVDPKKLRTLTFSGGDRELKINCLLLAARKISDEDWRLYVYGSEKKPLVESKFQMADEEKKGPVAIHAEDGDNNTSKLFVTVYGKYTAPITLGTKAEE